MSAFLTSKLIQMAFLKSVTYFNLRQIRYVSKFAVYVSHFELQEYRTKYTNVLTHSDVPKEQWSCIKDSLLKKKFLTPVVADTIILDICDTNEFADAGISYYRSLENEGSIPSIITTSKCLLLYAHKKGSITELDKEHIMKLYKTIAEKCTDALNDYVVTCCVKALCIIDKWQEAITLVESLKYVGEKNKAIYSTLISYFFTNEMYELGNKYLALSFKNGLGPSTYVYNSYWEYCLKEKRLFKRKMEALFLLWREYGIIPSKKIVDECIEVCNNFGWSATRTSLKCSKCAACAQDLSEENLSESQFQYLSNYIMQKVIIEKCYQITHPMEIKNFKKFIDKTKPYTVVVDALNVLYSCTRNEGIDVNRLYRVLHSLQKQNEKVLLIGRHHLQNLLQSLKGMATFYLLRNDSKDDLFILYAALASGNNTKVVSKDFMRQHKSLINNHELRVVFRRWQYLHQYTYNLEGEIIPAHSITTGGECYMHIGVQKQNDCWHIPYQSSTKEVLKYQTYVDINHWICFNMRPTN